MSAATGLDEKSKRFSDIKKIHENNKLTAENDWGKAWRNIKDKRCKKKERPDG